MRDQLVIGETAEVADLALVRLYIGMRGHVSAEVVPEESLEAANGTLEFGQVLRRRLHALRDEMGGIVRCVDNDQYQSICG